MRLGHLLLTVLFTAIALAIARDAVGRVALVVFVTGLGEVVFGTAAIMALVQTIGAIGQAERPAAYAEALAATAVVPVVASLTMLGLLVVGGSLVLAVTG